jgi:DNA-binding MurR/RpiR family transcriptional regulator
VAALYKSEYWLRREYITLKKKPAVIAQEQKVSEMTIYRYLKKFGMIR